ncbi:urease accessory protein UreF [Solirhodobacter olei]|uniref:urease accessory protein UreF n=1 Tax=Solirhodobacter olei TaxID=2493082 RepID=UPI000FDC2882|nr:urease accessory protein UreF [Solirhodobacter olei]
MADATALLTLAQWLSPAFPVGGYAYSHGLEWAIAEGRVKDAEGLRAWLEGVLAEGSGRTDAILLVQALTVDPAEISELARALAPSRERLLETMEQGAAFSATTNALTGADWPAMPLPVAVGAAARSLEATPEEIAALYLQAFAGNLVQAGVRFLPLGQTEGQKVLAALRPLILRLAAEAAGASPSDLGSGALASDLAAMQHETMDVRIFRT